MANLPSQRGDGRFFCFFLTFNFSEEIMKNNLELITLFISVLAFSGGMITWYTGVIKKQYASQRDFEHLKRSYASLSDNVRGLMAEVDDRANMQMLELKEVKALLMAIMVKLSPNELSTGWFRENPNQVPKL
jgi:predicted component of type VI protein secretion system